jgi:hypothetical protein
MAIFGWDIGCLRILAMGINSIKSGQMSRA